MRNTVSTIIKTVLISFAIIGALAFLREFLLNYHTRKKGYITCSADED